MTEIDHTPHDHAHQQKKPNVRFFAPPVQRQKWGDTQILPHVNWGDLFFDLFYVAGAYNLGNILLNSPTFEGLLYFFGAFIAIYCMWLDKMFYDGRFAIDDDLWHRIFEVANLCCVATAVLHIRPVDVFSNLSGDVAMFAFSLALTVSSLLTMWRYAEIMMWGIGERPLLAIVGRRDMLYKSIMTAFNAAACIYAGVQYFGAEGEVIKDDDHHDDHRFLAEAVGSSESYYTSENRRKNNIPIWLIITGPYVYFAVSYILVMFCMPGNGGHKKITIPTNIEFSIHRFGEWTMLMLGESILSLLIVDIQEEWEYYKTFFAGILSVVLMQYLHFKSQPHHPDEHAMRRSKNGAFLFNVMNQFYSAALVVMGVSYKMFLYEYTYSGESDSHRSLHHLDGRHLAGGGATQFDTEDRRQRIANLFTGALCVAWVSSDIMLLAHKGIKGNMNRFSCESKILGGLRVLVVLARLGLIIFVATLSQYQTDPVLVAEAGLSAIVGQVLLRVIGESIFPKEKIHHDTSAGHGDEENQFDDEKWPNTTEARAIPAKEDHSMVVD